MADKAISWAKHYMKPVRPFLANSIPTFKAKEAASQTFEKGAVLVNKSGNTGTLAEGSESSNKVAGVVGVAVEAGENGSSKTTHFVPAAPGIIFEAAVNGSASSASKYTLKQTDLFATYGLGAKADASHSSKKVWFVDKSSASSNFNVRIVGLKDAPSTVQGHVYFVFSKSTVYGV